MTLIDITLKRAAEVVSVAKRESQVPLSASLCMFSPLYPCSLTSPLTLPFLSPSPSTLSGGHTSSLLHYSDSVLKLLPVIKTMINFRQRLLAPSKPSLEVVKKEGDTLSLEERVQNAGSVYSKLRMCVSLPLFSSSSSSFDQPSLRTPRCSPSVWLS